MPRTLRTRGMRNETQTHDSQNVAVLETIRADVSFASLRIVAGVGFFHSGLAGAVFSPPDEAFLRGPGHHF